jgi:hypothetical protein
MKCVRKITSSQQKALDWLNNHGGTGVFGKDGHSVIAGGSDAPFMRSSWIALRDAQRITINGNRLTSLSEPTKQPIAINASDEFAHGRVAAMPGAE